MRFVDVYAGTGSSIQAVYDAGHEVAFIEYKASLCAELRERFPRAIVIQIDARTFAKDPWRYLPEDWKRSGIDGAWLSPPCTVFSRAGRGTKKLDSSKNDKEPPLWRFAGLNGEPESYRFFGPRFPNTAKAREGVALVLAALEVVRKLQPRFWWMENPQGGLQTLAFMEDRGELERLCGSFFSRVTVTHCQYETDIPLSERRMKPTVLWGKWPMGWRPLPACKNGAPCHVASPRGSRTGTQGRKGAKERGMMPYALGFSILNAVDP